MSATVIRPLLSAANVEEINTILTGEGRIRNFQLFFYARRVKVLLFGRDLCLCIHANSFDELVQSLKLALSMKKENLEERKRLRNQNSLPSNGLAL